MNVAEGGGRFLLICFALFLIWIGIATYHSGYNEFPYRMAITRAEWSASLLGGALGAVAIAIYGLAEFLNGAADAQDKPGCSSVLLAFWWLISSGFGWLTNYFFTAAVSGGWSSPLNGMFTSTIGGAISSVIASQIVYWIPVGLAGVVVWVVRGFSSSE